MQKPNARPSPGWTPLTETKWFQRSRLFFRWTFYGLAGCAASVLLGFLVLKSQPLPEPVQPLTTHIYSDDGRLIDELHSGEKREYVPLENIPPALIQATIAVEDRFFYDHFGLSPRGILRAAWTDLKEMALVEGASTITQQLARNLYLSHDRTWARKLKEAKYALQLEIHYDKDTLLEMYLNEVYFGHQAYGVGQAAKMFFEKKPEDLTVAECALLAGIPKGAGTYSPYIHPDNAKERQLVVLKAMEREGYLTGDEVNEIARQPLSYKPPQTTETQAPYFRDYIKSLAVHRYGLNQDQIENGGLHIYTTLDLDLQQQAERAIQQHIDTDSELQAALIAVDSKTGAIKAMVGGTDYEKTQYNRTLAKRQPGSAFKPFLYLSALEDGFTPATMMKSEPTTFTYGDDEVYKPQNYHGQYAYRPITMREALVRSDNVYAVKTHFKLGLQPLVETAEQLGIKENLSPHPSLALGSIPVSPLEMTEAYTTIARQGEHVGLTAIKRIEDSRGNVLAEADITSERVASPAHTFVLTHMMQGVFDDEGGTGNIVRQLVKRPVAGKTGTTDWDSWMIGFDTDLVTTVWVGYDQNEKLSYTDARAAKWVWGSFMQRVTRGKANRVFEVPEGVTPAYIDPASGRLATENCPNYYLEYFVTGTQPTETCDVHGGSRPAKPVPVERKEVPERSWFDRLKDWWQH